MNKYNVYYKNNQFRNTDLTREQAINHYNWIVNEVGLDVKGMVIYCSTKDNYVLGQRNMLFYKDSFKDAFLDLSSELGRIHFDEDGGLLENTPRGLKYKVGDKICFVKDNKVEYI